MSELALLQDRYSKENFLLYLIEKDIQLRKSVLVEEDADVTEKDVIDRVRYRMTQNDLMREIMMHIPIEDREEIGRIKTRNNSW